MSSAFKDNVSVEYGFLNSDGGVEHHGRDIGVFYTLESKEMMTTGWTRVVSGQRQSKETNWNDGLAAFIRQ